MMVTGLHTVPDASYKRTPENFALPLSGMLCHDVVCINAMLCFYSCLNVVLAQANGLTYIQEPGSAAQACALSCGGAILQQFTLQRNSHGLVSAWYLTQVAQVWPEGGERQPTPTQLLQVHCIRLLCAQACGDERQRGQPAGDHL